MRSRAHRAWRHGQVLLVEHDARLTLAVPARELDAELVLDALARLAKAVGASPDLGPRQPACPWLTGPAACGATACPVAGRRPM